MRRAWPPVARSGRLVLMLVAVALARPAIPAARESEVAVQALLRAEESLAETAELAHLANLRAQETAALALARASAALAVALESPEAGSGAGAAPGDEAAESAARAAVAREQRLVMAQLAHAQAREALDRVLAAASPLEAQAAERRAHVTALRQALARLRATAPPRGELDGSWTIVLNPLDETITARLTQEGPFVGGSFESSTGATGTLSGQVAGGHVRLERHEPMRGKVADIVGMMTKAGGVEGTWQSTVLGTGRAEAGTFTATSLAESETADP